MLKRTISTDDVTVNTEQSQGQTVKQQACYFVWHFIARIHGPKLSLRSYNAQVGEILAGVKVMNKVIGLGMPVRQPFN